MYCEGSSLQRALISVSRHRCSPGLGKNFQQFPADFLIRNVFVGDAIDIECGYRLYRAIGNVRSSTDTDNVRRGPL